MGGTQRVASTPGVGTRFSLTVELPPAEAAPERATEEPWDRAARLTPESPVSALVVDDVAENREVLAWMLERVGAQVKSRGRPDIVFLDIRLPGLSGRQTVGRIAARHGRSPMRFMAVSGGVTSPERIRAPATRGRARRPARR